MLFCQEALSDEVAGEWKTEFNEKTPKISARCIPGRGHSPCGCPEAAVGLRVAAVSERGQEIRQSDRGQTMPAIEGHGDNPVSTQGKTETLQGTSMGTPTLG